MQALDSKTYVVCGAVCLLQQTPENLAILDERVLRDLLELIFCHQRKSNELKDLRCKNKSKSESRAMTAEGKPPTHNDASGP
eukprot:scaffold19141_cov20-Prasinocladus_malaysianus.AAC.1